MKVEFSCIADGVNKSLDGKVNVLGIFDKIWAVEFPAVISRPQILIRFSFSPMETGRDYDCLVELVGPDGDTVEEFKLPFRVTKDESGNARGDLIGTFPALRFPSPGVYTLKARIGDKKIVSLKIEANTLSPEVVK